MYKTIAPWLFSALLLIASNLIAQDKKGFALAAEQNISWLAPTNHAKASMPLGNGDIGLNVWVDEKGELCFYIAKTDAWDENGRLLKIGKVKLRFSPNPFQQGTQFEQILKLENGAIEVKALHNKQAVKLTCWVDANNPAITIDARVPDNMELQAITEVWRNKTDTIKKLEFSDLNYFPEIYGPTIRVADQLLATKSNQVSWLHHNPDNPGYYTHLKMQGLAGFNLPSPLKDRIFGASMMGSAFTKLNDSTLVSSKGKNRQLHIVALTQHPSTTEKWVSEIDRLLKNINESSTIARYEKHRQWWQQFWGRSWISIDCADTITTALGVETQGKVLTRAYTLQRFITACAARGKFPIKFNGSLFTVEHKQEEGFADYRRWGTGYWWQNTRLPVLGMPASGDFDMMQSFFNMYMDQLPLQVYRTRATLNQEGAYFPECVYFWGGSFTEAWGKKSVEEKADKIQESHYHKYEWVSGPEMVSMMMDYYRFTRDTKFASEKLFPYAKQVILFFDQYYKKNEAGKLVFYPSQALETWWDCTNALPEVAGLHALVKELPALPGLTLPQDLSTLISKIAPTLPAIPVHMVKGQRMLAPAEKFDKLSNVENPELYAVFPFRHYGIDKPEIELAVNAWHNRNPKGYFGWRQDDLWAALLGITEEARKGVLSRASTWDKEHLFPAFWGPNYDWTPDQDHGGVFVKTLQEMLLQYDGETPRLLPAWPKNWNVRFKLHAPGNKIVEGAYLNGKTTHRIY